MYVSVAVISTFTNTSGLWTSTFILGIFFKICPPNFFDTSGLLSGKDLSPLLVSILKVLNFFSFNNSNTVLAISSILVFVI